MNTDHPTVEFYFVYSFTSCKLRVYEEEKKFALKILKALQVEFIHPEANDSFQEIDTCILLSLVSDALPHMLKECFTQNH